LRARVVQLGGRIIEQCEVQQVVVEGDVVSKLVTARGEFSADRYIVTAGAWTKQVLGERGSALGIKPIRGQMLLFKFDAPPLPHIVLQQGMYLIPRRDGHLLVGSTLEDVGFDKSTTNAARDMLLQRASVLLPALQSMPVVKHWAGLRPGSPDNIPAIGQHPRLENLYINSGHFRYGVTMAPASVEILLNKINGKLQPFDVSPYRWVS
jgi:glycine oxidase